MWLAIRFPQLPLEALLINHHEQVSKNNQALAVSQSNKIIACNQQAQQQGIKINQSLSSVHALSDDIQIFERHMVQEQQCLNNLALLLYAYSPCVAIKNGQVLLIEIASSLKLYHGLDNLLQKLEVELSHEEITFHLAIGDTPKSAELLTFTHLNESHHCWALNTKKNQKEALHKIIDKLAVDFIDFSSTERTFKTLEKIHSVGITKIGELKNLPSSSIRKRFGQNLSLYLAQLNGEVADLQTYFLPPENFSQQLEFMAPVHHRQALLFPIKRLLNDLCRFLTLKQKHCQYLFWNLIDSENNSLGFDVFVSDNQINQLMYLELTQLNLERFSLHAPIEKISLKSGQLNDLDFDNQNLFEQASDFKQDATFINKIQAKLGQSSCYHPVQQNQNIPELATSQLTKINQQKILQKSTAKNEPSNPLNRPSWLFKKPQQIGFNQNKLIWRGELQIISSAERITADWWSQKVARDYFVAEHDNGSLYWVFYDKLKQQWFLQGVYG